MTDKDLQYHLKIRKGDLGRYVFLPGDPDRAKVIAEHFDDPVRHVSFHREYSIWEGYLAGERVAACSTGIGGPSAAIAIQELSRAGSHTFLRIGTCGLLQDTPKAEIGDLIIPSGVIRRGGTADAYVPQSFPAVPDPEFQQTLVGVAREKGCRYRSGIVHSKDAFFIEDPEDLPRCIAVKEEWDVWRRAGVLATEMESDTLFVLGSIYGLRVATILLGIGHLEAVSQSALTGAKADQLGCVIGCGIEAMRRIIELDK